MKKMQNIDELEAFLLKHGENIVDLVGGEIDRIELKLKVRLITFKRVITFYSSFLKLMLIRLLYFIFAEKAS